MIYVGSLTYSPVYKSHCCAFGKACEEGGYSIKYLFSHEYEWMLSKEVKNKTVFVGHTTGIASMLKDTLDPRNMAKIARVFSQDTPTHVYVHNYHLLNHYIAGICRKRESRFIYHAHEPYVENKSAHGGLRHYWLYLSEEMERRLLRDTDIAVVSSKEASILFDRKYHWFKGRKAKVPLMYEDLGRDINKISDRKYITFVGPPVPAKGPEIFLRIVDYSAKHDIDWHFLLISRTIVTDPRFHNRENLIVFQKDRISDEEFGNLIHNSRVVVTPYKRETQSSVILVSYMYGTPVVSSNVGGLPEFVSHKERGYLVDKDAPVEEWIKGISYTIKNFHRMSPKCRAYFTENSSGRNWKRYLSCIIA
jgi:glycosyltransferase involved in cell wall biosynthesis